MAGFGQIEGQVMKVGMVAEATCISKLWAIIPMVVTNVQDYIAAGQFRGGEQLIEAQQLRVRVPFSFHGADLQGRARGRDTWQQSHRDAYTSNHELISSGKIGSFKSVALHVVDDDRACARVAVADLGVVAADQDAGAERALNCFAVLISGYHAAKAFRSIAWARSSP